jgi:hypothetical protein
MLVALIVLQRFLPELPRYPHLPWLTNPSTHVAQSINGVVTSNFVRLNRFLTTPNRPNRSKSLACVASTTNIVYGQLNNQVLEESSEGRSKQVS